ncbi:hypothetical protein NQ314_011589 [Rhamnusium bicolor]|uniref:Uncharacterized protein n=1 Tax=Rhamnusium bicolor TaxID=1586634 RepID=A0AAV8XI88_9CUCU|nr:hypothetical protein NQ314_011589 [Rhamnusium bicolor]
MYGLYQEYCVENKISKVVSQSMYREIFNSEFNFSFFCAEKNVCDICNKYDNSNIDQKQLLQIEYDVHLHNKKLARDVKNSDKEKAAHNNTFCAAVFDLQQILPVPKSEVGLCYYKLKLSTYNFTIYSLGNRDCFLLHVV